MCSLTPCSRASSRSLRTAVVSETRGRLLLDERVDDGAVLGVERGHEAHLAQLGERLAQLGVGDLGEAVGVGLVG